MRNNNKIFTKIISIILAVLFIAEILPMSVWAEEINGYNIVTNTEISPVDNNESPIIGEIIDERDACKKVFQREDGTFTAIFTQDPIHYYDNGEWLEIDNTLTEENGVITNSDNSFSVNLPAEISSEDEISISVGNNSISFYMENIESANAVLLNTNTTDDESELINFDNLNSTVNYENINENTSLSYDIGADTLKESIILSEYTSDVAYSYIVNPNGGSLQLNDNGSVNIYNDGNITFVIDKPYMFDVNEKSSSDIMVSLNSNADGTYTLTYTPDDQWLSDSSTHYPVTIDPSIRYYNASFIVNSYVGTNTASESDLANYYFIEQNSDSYTELYLKISDTVLSNLGYSYAITRAELSMYCQAVSNNDCLGVYAVTQPWDSTNTDILNKGTCLLDYNIIPYGNSISRYVWDITDLASAWSLKQHGNYGIAVVPYNDSDCNTKIYRSSASINTNRRPWIEIDYTVIDEMAASDVEVVDMGRAGTLHLNKYTGTYYIERTDLSLNGNIMPVSLDFVYNPWGAEASSSAALGGYWCSSYFNKLVWGGTVSANGVTRRQYKYRDVGLMLTTLVEVLPTDEDYETLSEDYTQTYLTTHTCYKAVSGDMSKVLFVPRNATANNDYVNMIIEDTQYRYVLDAAGRLTTIVNKKTNAEINISFSSATSYMITNIVDGVGRKYKLNYANNSYGKKIVTGISTLNSANQVISVNTTNGTVPIGVTYNVTGETSDKRLLMGITYGDGESVSYTYNSNNLITSLTNVDGSRLELEYSGKRVVGYTKYSKYISANNAGNCFESALSISFDNAGQRTFRYYEYNSTTPKTTVIQQYNSNLETTNNISSDGSFSYSDYADENNGYSELLSYSCNSDNAVNILNNGNFNSMDSWVSVPLGASHLQTVQGVTLPNFSNLDTSMCKIDGAANRNTRLYQNIATLEANGEEDVYTLSGWVYPQSNVFSGTYTHNYLHTEKSIALCAVDNDGNILARYDFNSTANVLQFGAISFRVSSDLDNVKIVFMFDNQFGSVYVDGISLTKNEDSYVYVEEIEDETLETMSVEDHYITINGTTYRTEPCSICGCAQCNSPITVTNGNDEINVYYNCNCEIENSTCYCLGCRQERGRNETENANGDVTLSTLTNGTQTMTNGSYTYSADGNYLSSTRTDYGSIINNNYNTNTGFLDSYSISDNNPMNYTYNGIGALERVSQTVSGLSDGTVMSAEFKYSGDLIRQMSHNGSIYFFDYNSYGNLTNIKVAGNESNYSSAQTIVTYGYSSNQVKNSITYGNGTTINYTFDGDNISEINYSTGQRYKYAYDADGALNVIYDYSAMVASIYTDGSLSSQKNFTDTNGTITLGTEIYSTSTSNDGTVEQNIFGETLTTTATKETYMASDDTIRAESGISYMDNDITVASVTDFFNREIEKEISVSNNNVYNLITELTYNDTDEIASNLVTGIKNTYSGNVLSDYTYTYDNGGNITEIKNGDIILNQYTYDEANQLVAEYDYHNHTATTYVYDKNGNIVSKTPYENVTSQNLTSATELATINYTYSDSSWSDKLTAYDGQAITYDASGNPTSYKGATLTWNGRLLTSYEKGERRFEYTYNENGLRTGKKIYRDNVLGAVCRYIWDGDKLIGQEVEAVGDNPGGMVIEYLYKDDEAVGIIIDNSPYVFEKNIQGDVVGIHPACDDSLVIKFNYTAWGEIYFEQTNSFLVALISALILPYINITYRGYFCDHEIGLYYLQSRYYDPETGRFINADDTDYLAYDNTPISFNLFAYCENNPVNYSDKKGYSVSYFTISLNFYDLKDLKNQHSDITSNDGIVVSYGTFDGKNKASWPKKFKGTQGYILLCPNPKNWERNAKKSIYNLRVKEQDFYMFFARAINQCDWPKKVYGYDYQGNYKCLYSVFAPCNPSPYHQYKIGKTTCASFVAKWLYACLPTSTLLKLKDNGKKLKSITLPIELYSYLKNIL